MKQERGFKSLITFGIVDIGKKCEQHRGSIPLGSISLTEGFCNSLEMASQVLVAAGQSPESWLLEYGAEMASIGAEY